MGVAMENEARPEAPSDLSSWEARLELARRATRCRARRKSDGRPCQGPAIKGRPTCRMHGGKGGGPRGSRNGRYVHGHHTKEAKAELQQVRAEMRELREMMRAGLDVF